MDQRPTGDTARPDGLPTDQVAARILEDAVAPTVVGEGHAPTLDAVQASFPDLEVLALVGQGGMGHVYRVRQRHLDRDAALKLLREDLGRDPAFAERFMREARTLARLDHPGIVRIHDFGEKAGRYFLLMEYVDGASLRALMEAGEMEPEEALAIVPQVCAALQYAHDLGVVHRDIKPSNILMDDQGRVKIADFGLAKLTHENGLQATLTSTNQLMGSVHYMAPEQLRSPQDVDHRADIFSLGVVFYEMLTGDLPVGRVRPPSASRTLDARVDAIVMRSLERERAERYQRAGSVGDALHSLGPLAAGGRAARGVAGWRTWPWHWMAVAGLVVTFIATSGTFSGRVLTHPARAHENTVFLTGVAAVVGSIPTLIFSGLALILGSLRARVTALLVVVALLASIVACSFEIAEWLENSPRREDVFRMPTDGHLEEAGPGTVPQVRDGD